MEGKGAPKWGRSGGRGRQGKNADGEADTSRTNVYIDPDKDFPDRDEIVPAKPLTTAEKAQVDAYRRFRDRVHNGPLYTVLGDDDRVAKRQGARAFVPKVVDAFDGVETYGQRYTVRRRNLPKLDTREFVRGFFPEELWSTMSPKLSSALGKRKRDDRRDKNTSARLQRAVDESAEVSGGNKEAGEDGEDGAAVRDEEQADEVIDDDYATDDDDMVGDYNAEAYFDGGDDAGDDGDGDRDEEF